MTCRAISRALDVAIVVLLFFFFAGTVFIFFFRVDVPNIYILDARTERAEFVVDQAVHAAFDVRGVQVRTGSQWVTALNDAGTRSEICYSGRVFPSHGTKVVLEIQDQIPVLTLVPPARADDNAAPTATTIQRTSADMVLGWPTPDAPAAQPQVNPFSLEGMNIPLTGPGALSQQTNLVSGRLAFDEPVTFSANPACDATRAGPGCADSALCNLPFGREDEPFVIQGQLFAGTPLRALEVDDALEALPLYARIEGTVTALVLPLTCGFDSKRCGQILAIEDGEMVIPTGATVTAFGDIDGPAEPASFWGHAFLEDGLYRVQATTKANEFVITLPGFDKAVDKRNAIAITQFDQLRADKWTTAIVTVLFSLLGVLIGLRQVDFCSESNAPPKPVRAEDQAVPPEPDAPAPPPTQD